MPNGDVTTGKVVVAYTGDVISAGAIVASFVGWLPLIAAFAGMIWYMIQIWESKTVQAGLARWRVRRKSLRITRLNKKVTRAHRKLERAQHRLNILTDSGEEE